MKTLIIDKKITTLHIDNSVLVADESRIPLYLIEMLILTHDIPLSVKTLLGLGRAHIALLCTSRNSRDFCLTLPLEAKNAELKRAQYEALDSRLEHARYFISQKITSHAEHLKRLGVPVESALWLQKLEEATQISDIMGYEGSFAKLYFGHFFAQLPKNLHQGRRSKNPPLDPVNATLSYLYTIAYHTVTARLYMAGLEPSIGFLHEPFRSHYALSSDLMECMRADLNTQVMEWFLQRILEAEDFSKKGGVFLRYESRKKLWPYIKASLDTIDAHCDREIARLRKALS